jgi:predicted RNA-binding protein with PUA domain
MVVLDASEILIILKPDLEKLDISRSDVFALHLVERSVALRWVLEENDSISSSTTVVVLSQMDRVVNVSIFREEIDDVLRPNLERKTLYLHGDHFISRIIEVLSTLWRSVW